jgi:hypothetical protein
LEKKKKKGLRIEPQKRDEMNRNNGEEKELLQTTLSVRLNLNEKSSHYSKSRKTTKKKELSCRRETSGQKKPQQLIEADSPIQQTKRNLLHQRKNR